MIVNREPTPLDHLADAVLHGEAGTLLPALVDAALRRAPAVTARLLVIQHEPSSPPGLLAAAAAATGVELWVVEAPGEPVPATP